MPAMLHDTTVSRIVKRQGEGKGKGKGGAAAPSGLSETTAAEFAEADAKAAEECEELNRMCLAGILEYGY